MDRCEDVKSTIQEFIDDLRDNLFADNGDAQGDLMLVSIFFQRMHPESVMHHVIKKLLPHASKIKDRDLSYFEGRMVLFEGLPEDRIEVYSGMVKKGILTGDDLENVWAYLETLVLLAEDYRKDK